MTLDELRSLLNAGPTGSAVCPAHDDSTPSLSVNAGTDGRILLHCHAGCRVQDVLAALGITMAELAGDGGFGKLVTAEYRYANEEGTKTLYTVSRTAGKGFHGVLPVKKNRVPYNLPALKWARDHNLPVWILEGEKDC